MRERLKTDDCFYSDFRKRAESGGRVKLKEKGRPCVG
jgi:hypothetical protein